MLAPYRDKYNPHASGFPQGVPQSGNTSGAAADRFAKHVLLAPHFHPFPSPGDACVNKLSREHRRILIRKNEKEPVKLRALALVNRDGIDGLVLRQPDRMQGAERALRCPKKNTKLSIRSGIRQGNADVAIVKMQVVIILSDQNWPAPVPPPLSADEPLSSQLVLHQEIHGIDPKGTLSQSAYNSEVVQLLESLLGITHLEKIMEFL
jgi:hypothetical protein